MIRVHVSDFESTRLTTGEETKGKLLTITATKEKIVVGLILRDDGKIEPFFPDIQDQVGFVMTNTEIVTEAETMQNRENRKATYEKRVAVKFPPQMARQTVPVLPFRSREPAFVSDAQIEAESAEEERRENIAHNEPEVGSINHRIRRGDFNGIGAD